jgi:hypothetical protein
MLADRTNLVRNVRADNHAVLLQGRRENVSLVEDFSGNRAAILRRYLELAPGARAVKPFCCLTGSAIWQGGSLWQFNAWTRQRV